MEKLRKNKIAVLQKLMQGKISKDEAKEELEALKPLTDVIAIQTGDHFMCGNEGVKGLPHKTIDTDLGPATLVTQSQLDEMVTKLGKTRRVRSYITITE